ncbi:AAA domain-containing protein [Choanephora cucurbitarum]|nr:AAA domain-containing protein [Choanephora cucurbitarum]
MKSRKACEKYTREFLNKRYSVIVDRCNFDRDQRKTWVDIAQEYKLPIDCIVMTADKQECRNRIEVRTEHPTGVVGREGVSVLNRFVRNYHPPTPESGEGFSRILYLDPSPNPVCTEERVSEVFELLSACPVLGEERVAHKLPKYKEVVDSEGWTTITRSDPEANKE